MELSTTNHPAIGISLINHPAIGVPPFMETTIWPQQTPIWIYDLGISYKPPLIFCFLLKCHVLPLTCLLQNHSESWRHAGRGEAAGVTSLSLIRHGSSSKRGWRYHYCDVLCIFIYEIFWNTMKYYEILWHTMKYYEVFWNTMKYNKILWNTMTYYERLKTNLHVVGKLNSYLLGSPCRMRICVYIYIYT